MNAHPPGMGPSKRKLPRTYACDIGKLYLNRSRHLDIKKGNTMTPLESELLAALLGQLDALFEPVNFAWAGSPEQYQAQWQRRDKYLGRYDWTGASLLPWSNPGEDVAEKKRYSRAMAAMEDQGLVRMDGRTAGLTTEGLTAARELVGHLQLEDCLPGLDVLLSFMGTDHEWIGGETGYVSEASLAGFEPRPPVEVGKPRLPDSALWVIDALIPLAIAGLIEHDFNSDFELPLYCLTEEGRNLAEKRRHTRKAGPKAWTKLAQRVRQYKNPAAYADAWASAKAALESVKPLQANRVKHPVGDIWPAPDIRAAEAGDISEGE